MSESSLRLRYHLPRRRKGSTKRKAFYEVYLARLAPSLHPFRLNGKNHKLETVKEKIGELYFVAVLPEEEVREQVQKIKEEVAEKYASKASLKSPPHITIYMPFRWKKEREDELHGVLEKMASSHSAFELQLKDFGAFKPRVIFIDLLPSDELEELQKDVITAFKSELKLIDKGFEERPFHPHMTIAFRDLKKPMFFKAWNEGFKERSFHETVKISEITLLQHNGRCWDICKTYPLKA